MKKCPIFHIGLPKCASTYLQEVVFPKLKTWNYLRDTGEQKLFFRNPYYKLPKEMSYLKNARNVISHEEIAEELFPYPTSGCPYNSISDSPYMEREYGLSNTLRVIRDFGFVLVVIRRQDDWLESILKSRPVFYGDPKNVFLDYPMKYSKKKPYLALRPYGHFLLESIDYYKLFIRISSQIGRERIKILLYEDLVHDPMLFFTQLSEIFEEDLLHLVPLSDDKRNVSKIKPERIPSYLRLGIRNRFGHIDVVKFIVELMVRLFLREKLSLTRNQEVIFWLFSKNTIAVLQMNLTWILVNTVTSSELPCLSCSEKRGVGISLSNRMSTFKE